MYCETKGGRGYMRAGDPSLPRCMYTHMCTHKCKSARVRRRQEGCGTGVNILLQVVVVVLHASVVC